MDIHALLRLVHITSFAAWFGTILASYFLLKALEPRLAGKGLQQEQAAEDHALLRRFIKLETKIADVAVIGVIVSGLLLAHFHHGWSVWVFVKIGLMALQVALTLGYIIKAIQPITYPCTVPQYRPWYRLFAISFTMFGIMLAVTFFLLMQ